MLFNVLFIWLQLRHVLFYTSYFFIILFIFFYIIISITISCPLAAVVKKFPSLWDK